MGESVGVAVSFSAGLFSFLSPCVLPLFPSYLSFITGMSVADLTADLSGAMRWRILGHALAFVVGFSIVFVALGASFSAAGQFLLDYRDWIRRIGGILIVVFGLYIVGVLRVGIFGRTQQWQLREKPAGYLGSLAVGVTFATGWTPCVGPILGAILSLASTANDVGRGVGLLTAYSAGLGVPFLLAAGARPVLEVLQALPCVHPGRGAGGGCDPGRGGRARRHQLLRRSQQLDHLAHARLAPEAALAACASTSAFPRRPPTSAPASTPSAWRGHSATRSSPPKPRG